MPDKEKDQVGKSSRALNGSLQTVPKPSGKLDQRLEKVCLTSAVLDPMRLYALHFGSDHRTQLISQPEFDLPAPSIRLLAGLCGEVRTVERAAIAPGDLNKLCSRAIKRTSCSTQLHRAWRIADLWTPAKQRM